jgi:hypothetical protein
VAFRETLRRILKVLPRFGKYCSSIFGVTYPPLRYTYMLSHVDPLLGNDSVNTFQRQQICRQQSDNFRCYASRCKHNNRGRGVFYSSVSRLYKWYRVKSNHETRVEAGPNPSTVALRVIKENPMCGDITGPPCSWGNMALQAGGVSNLRQQNAVMSPAGLAPENDYAGENQQQLLNDRPILSSERMLRKL